MFTNIHVREADALVPDELVNTINQPILSVCPSNMQWSCDKGVSWIWWCMLEDPKHEQALSYVFHQIRNGRPLQRPRTGLGQICIIFLSYYLIHFHLLYLIYFILFSFASVCCEMLKFGLLSIENIWKTDTCRVEWGKAPMWGKGPTTEITFMDGNRGNICTCVFSNVIGPPVATVADGENTS